MNQYGNLTLGEIVNAAERRAASGEKVHQGFDFASLAPSPLKVAAEQEAERREAERAAAEQHVYDPTSVGIEGDLDNAWTRLKRQINPS